jgi:hypothetical protein
MLDMHPRVVPDYTVTVRHKDQTSMRVLAFVLIVGFAGIANADGEDDRLSLAPDKTDPACDPQPSDDEKLWKAMAYLISNTVEVRPVIEINGKLTSRDGLPLTVDNPKAALAAQPDCCWISYDDRESPRARELRDRLGDNFGGFAYARIGYRVRSGELAGQVANVWASYALNACGYPVFVMSDD